MINENRIMLLSQLINGLSDNFQKFEKAYENSNKEDFDSSKAAILELQKKIEYILKNL